MYCSILNTIVECIAMLFSGDLGIVSKIPWTRGLVQNIKLYTQKHRYKNRTHFQYDSFVRLKQVKIQTAT